MHFFAEKKEFSLLGTLGHLCTTFATESLSISPFYLSFVEYQYLILSLRYSWWTKSRKKILKEGEKKTPSTVKRKRILNLSRANVGCDPLISPLDKFSLQAKLFSFETAVMQTHTKITQKNVLHRNNVMYLMYSNSCQHAGLKISFISVCSSFYMFAMDNCL